MMDTSHPHQTPYWGQWCENNGAQSGIALLMFKLAHHTLSVLMEVCDFEQTFAAYMSKHLQHPGDADRVLTGSASLGSLNRVITESILILSDLTVALSGK